MSRHLDAALEAIDRVLDVGEQTDAGTDWAMVVTDPAEDPALGDPPIRCGMFRRSLVGHRTDLLIIDDPPLRPDYPDDWLRTAVHNARADGFRVLLPDVIWPQPE